MINAELAILGLVVEQPRHGYEIQQVIEERGMREWTEVGFSSIYYLLKRLERDGLIVGQLVQEGRGPARRVFSATPEGVAACREGVLAALSEPHRCYPPLQLGLANLTQVPTDQALAALRQRCQSLAEHSAHVGQRREIQRPLPFIAEAMFDHSLAMINCELRWTEELIAEIERMEDPGGQD